MKNVNDVDFDANINRDMCMKVNVMLLFIDIKLRVVDKYVCLSISCVLLSASFMCMMMQMYLHMNMLMYVQMIMDMYIDIYVCTSWKMKIDFQDCKYMWKMKF